jgi:hypothetical protein
MVRRLAAILGLVCATACAGTRRVPPPVALAIPDIPVHSYVLALTSMGDASCMSCVKAAFTPDVVLAIEKRLAELKQRGGDCASYAAVMESSYRSGQITIRPYMWRVGPYLASGEAKPNGDMILARDIDSLNVGVRTLEDMLHTMEHEAAHIAFHITPGGEVPEKRANEYVRACRA